MTDPSSAGQIVVFISTNRKLWFNRDFMESDKPHVKGVVAGELCLNPSHFKLTETAAAIFENYGIPCITNVDTRALVKAIRKHGTVKAIITDNVNDRPEKEAESGLVEQVSVKQKKVYINDGPHIVLIDYGYKRSILQYFYENGCQVTVVPYDYPYEMIQSLQPDGIVLSNGPGNPVDLSNQLDSIQKLASDYPTLGIGLGHQLIALAYGAKIKKLPFGHRGGNHPVKDMRTGKVYMTSQNHGYCVQEDSIDKNKFIVTFRHVNDHTVEGLKHKVLPVQSVQFYPGIHPGPQDTIFILNKFIDIIKKSGAMKYAVQ